MPTNTPEPIAEPAGAQSILIRLPVPAAVDRLVAVLYLTGPFRVKTRDGQPSLVGEWLLPKKVKYEIRVASEPTSGACLAEFVSGVEILGDVLQRLTPDSRVYAATFWDVTYLGGFPEDPRAHSKSSLVVDDNGLRISSNLIRWAEIAGVIVDGGEVAKSKIGPILLFGVLGLGARGAKYRAFLAVRRRDGATGHFQLERLSPHELKARIAPILFKVHVPFLDELPVSGALPVPQVTPLSVADELKKLADLRQAGVLTEAEFAAQKAKLLG